MVSQFPDGHRRGRDHFPRRNWTIAGLSQAVVVVEAAVGSGALITAEAALALGRNGARGAGKRVLDPSLSDATSSCATEPGWSRTRATCCGRSESLARCSTTPWTTPTPRRRAPAGRTGPAAGAPHRHAAVDPGTLAAKLGLPIQQVLIRLSRAELGVESGAWAAATRESTIAQAGEGPRCAIDPMSGPEPSLSRQAYVTTRAKWTRKAYRAEPPADAVHEGTCRNGSSWGDQQKVHSGGGSSTASAYRRGRFQRCPEPGSGVPPRQTPRNDS